MLGLVGFLVAAIVILAYAMSSSRVYVAVPPRQRYSFVAAYGLLAACMITWAIAVVVQTDETVKALVFATDIMMVVATGLMLNCLIDLLKYWWLAILFVMAAAIVLALRAYVYPPEAFVENGLLHFNMSPSVLAAVIVPLMALWLPASALVGQRIMGIKSLARLRYPMANVFMVLVIVTGLFLSARRPEMIILLFVAVILLFAILNIANMWLWREYHRKAARHG